MTFPVAQVHSTHLDSIIYMEKDIVALRITALGLSVK